MSPIPDSTHVRSSRLVHSSRLLYMVRHAFLATIVLSGIFSFSCLSLAQSHTVFDHKAPLTGLISVRAIALNPTNGNLYAVDSIRGTISIVSGRTHTTSAVKVGDSPVAVAVNTITNKVYVANNRSGTLSVLDGNTNEMIATINIGKTPYVVAVNSVTNKIYVSNTFSNLISIVDGATNEIKTVKAGSADQIVIDSESNRIYLLGYESSTLTVLNGADNSIEHRTAGKMHLWAVALDETARQIYVARIGSADVVALNEDSTDSTPISTGKIPCAIAINSKTDNLYVANCDDDSVTVIDGMKRMAVATIHVGKHPQAIAVDSNTNLIYVANTHGNSITVIDGASNMPLTTLRAGINPYSIEVDSKDEMVYVANLDHRSLTQINVHELQSHSIALKTANSRLE